MLPTTEYQINAWIQSLGMRVFQTPTKTRTWEKKLDTRNVEKMMIAAFQTPKLPGLKSVTVRKFDVSFSGFTMFHSATADNFQISGGLMAVGFYSSQMFQGSWFRLLQ